MKIMTTISATALFLSLSGCISQVEIMRPDEKRQAIKFSSESARDVFTCTTGKIKQRFPWDAKQKESTSANLVLRLYTKEYFLSDSAYFNYLVEKTDIDKNAIISKEEVVSLYKSYFPDHKYTQINPDDSWHVKLQAKSNEPLCDIH